MTALARLAVGMDGAEAMIEGMLPSIEDCHDCADFILVPLIWSRARYADRLPKALVERIDAAMLSYRYWMDEPGNDVQWYFSENHALLFHTACYLAGSLLPEATFCRSGRVGAEQSKVGAERVRAWLDHFEAWEMAEFNSAPYFPIDLKGLDGADGPRPDADIRDRAKAAILRLVEMVANSAHHGVLTGAQGRSYEHTLRASRTLELSGLSRLLWGVGNFGRRFHALPQMALLVRDHGLDVPAEFAARASLEAGEAQEWTFAQGADRFAALYHYKTAGFALGTASAYRWGDWGYQETVFQARLGLEPDACVWINHPGEVIHSGYGRPSYWGGCGTVPRVQQYRGLAILSFAVHEGQPDFTHAWFPFRAFEEARVGGEIALARSGEGAILSRDRAISNSSPPAPPPATRSVFPAPARSGSCACRRRARGSTRWRRASAGWRCAKRRRPARGGGPRLRHRRLPGRRGVWRRRAARSTPEASPSKAGGRCSARHGRARQPDAALHDDQGFRPAETGHSREESMKAIIAGLALALSASVAHAADVRMLWYSDGVEGEVMKDLLARFHEQNPDIDVTLDNVPIRSSRSSCRSSSKRGRARHRARHRPQAAVAPLARPHPLPQGCRGLPLGLRRAARLDAADGSNIIPGFMTQITLSSGFANKTLFDQAGVALPGEGATWDQWMEAAKAVRRASRCRSRPRSTARATASAAPTSPSAPATSPRTGRPRRSTPAPRPSPRSSSAGTRTARSAPRSG